MLGADARLLTEGEEIVSHDLFARLTSKKTITGEDENEETELKFLTEIRTVRDRQPDLFERIKRLPKKARSTRTLSAESGGAAVSAAGAGETPLPAAGAGETPLPAASAGETPLPAASAGETPAPQVDFPRLLTYFRQGKLDKFFAGTCRQFAATELDFLSAARILRPADPQEPLRPIPREFYELLDRNKAAFVGATTAEAEQAESAHRGSPSDAYILKRLKDKAVRRCRQYTEEDEEFVGRGIRLLEEGSLPKATAKKVAAALKKEIEPLRVLAVLRRQVKSEFFQPGPAAHADQGNAPREVILSSYLLQQESGNESPT